MNLPALKRSHRSQVSEPLHLGPSFVLVVPPLSITFLIVIRDFTYRCLWAASFLSLQFSFGSVKPQLLAMYSTLASSGIRVASEVDVASMGPRRVGEVTTVTGTNFHLSISHLTKTKAPKNMTTIAMHTIT